MGEWSRLNDQAIREASSETDSSSCNDIKYLISSPEHRHEDRFLFSAPKPDTTFTPQCLCQLYKASFSLGILYIHPRYTVSIEHQQQTEKRLYTEAEILAPHSVFKLGLKLSSALQLLCSLLLLSGLFHCWCSSCGSMLLVASQPQFSHHTSAMREQRPVVLNGDAEAVISTAKGIDIYPLQVQMHYFLLAGITGSSFWKAIWFVYIKNGQMDNFH